MSSPTVLTIYRPSPELLLSAFPVAALPPPSAVLVLPRLAQDSPSACTDETNDLFCAFLPLLEVPNPGSLPLGVLLAVRVAVVVVVAGRARVAPLDARTL